MIEYLTSTGSTNADLAARLVAGRRPAEGDWLVADRQVAGRGRHGRQWSDGHGNFMGSTVIYRQCGDPPATSLALVAGVAVQAAIAPHVPAPAAARIKWPNDVMIGAAKVSGVLLEAQGDAVIIGIGVNLAIAPPVAGRATIALSDLGAAPDRDGFAAALAAIFADEVGRWRRFGIEAVLARWHAAAHPPGTPLEVGEPGETPVNGVYAGLAADGALQLRLADGTTQTIHAGDVRLAAGLRQGR